MDFANVSAGPIVTILGGLTLLIAVDALLGSISAAAAGAFKWEYLYAVGRTKGAVLARVAILLGAGTATNFLDFSLFGLDADPFTVLGMGLAAPLAASTIASIAGNIGTVSSGDATTPQGIDPPSVPVDDIAEDTVTDEGTGG